MSENISREDLIYEKLAKTKNGDMSEIAGGLLDILNDNTIGRFKNVIRETEFKEKYLKMLYTLFKSKTQAERAKATRNEEYISWAELSRNFGEVDVIDDNSTDDNIIILFTVPSIYGYVEINRETVDSYTSKDLEDSAFGQFSFGKLASSFLTRADGNRFMAHKFLEKHLKNISNSELLVNNRREIALKWESIFSRYADYLGIDKKEFVAEETKKTEVKKENEEYKLDLDELGW